MMILLGKGGLGNNIGKMYIFETLIGVTFYGAIMMTFQELQGLSLSEVFYTKIGFVLSMALLEIPTGYFADVYGRKISLILGSLIELIAITIFAFADNFTLFLIVDILMGIALALHSGATSAMVYESLQEQNRANEYQKIWGDMHSYMMFSMAISAIIGGWVANQYGLEYAIYINIPFVALALLITTLLDEPIREKIVLKRGYQKLFIDDIRDIFQSSKVLQFIILYSATIYIFNQSIFPAYQHYYMEIGVGLVYFGLIHALFQVVSGFSARYAYKIERNLGIKNILILIPFIVAISYILMGTVIGIWSFIFIFLQQFVRGFREVVVSNYINKIVSSKQRATILSINSLVSKLLIAPMLLLWGFSLKYFSLTQTLLILGIVALIMAIGIFILIKGIGNDKRVNRFGSI